MTHDGYKLGNYILQLLLNGREREADSLMFIGRVNESIATSDKRRDVSLTARDGVRLLPTSRDILAIDIVIWQLKQRETYHFPTDLIPLQLE
jgi:hypothetical protein